MQKLNNGSDVLLFGCSGLLGQYIVYELNKKKINYFSFSRKKPRNVERKKWHSLHLEEKINEKNLNKIKQAKFVILNAALKPNLKNKKYSEYRKCNVDFINQILILQKKYKYKIIYISSIFKNRQFYKKKKLTDQNVFYLRSKLSAENLIKQKSKKNRYLIIKTTSIYGYGLDKHKFIQKMIKNKTSNNKYFDKEIYNFIHAYDIASFIVNSIKKSYYGIRYLVGDYISFEQIYNLINNNKYYYATNIEKKKSFFYTKSKFNFKRKINLKKGINLLKNNKFL